jgi:PII-like signaling protein
MAEESGVKFKLRAMPAQRLKVFITEEDRHDHQALIRAVLQVLHDAGIAWVAVYKEFEGFGVSRVVHSTRNEIMMVNLPLTIEAADTAEKINAILPRLAAMITSGLLETSPTSIIVPVTEQGPASLEGGSVC